MNAPASDTPATQTPGIRNGEWTCRATTLGFRKCAADDAASQHGGVEYAVVGGASGCRLPCTAALLDWGAGGGFLYLRRSSCLILFVTMRQTAARDTNYRQARDRDHGSAGSAGARGGGIAPAGPFTVAGDSDRTGDGDPGHAGQLPGVLQLAGRGLLHVMIYRRRTGYPLDLIGVRLGWITGILMFVIATVILTGAVLLNLSGRLTNLPAVKAALDRVCRGGSRRTVSAMREMM